MFLSPEKLVEYCDVHHGMKVADLGASVGMYAIPLARRVGKQGRIYAVDIQKELLLKLVKEARQEKLENIEIILGDIEIHGDTKLNDQSVDRVFLINTLFQAENKEGVILETKRILKNGGKVIFVDWAGSFGGVGPRPQDVLPPETAVNIFEKSGFKKDYEMPAGSHHYGIIFIK